MKLSKSWLFAACSMAAMCGGNVFYTPKYRIKTGNTLADGKPVKKQVRQLHEFRIKGNTIMAYSRKDAIKRLKAKGLL